MKKILIFIILFLINIINYSENNNTNLEILLNEITELANENSEIYEHNIRNEIIDFAKENLDKPYSWGAIGPNKFDCSGFVQFVFNNKTDLDLPRISREMSKYNKKKNIDELMEGDLLFFITSRKSKVINHVGIYIGDGEFIHASSASKKVTISSIKDGFYKKSFKWAISPFKE